MSKTAALVVVFGTAANAFDMGPTFGRDFAGQDYNVTMWHSPSSEAANHYEAAALRCEKYCLDDPKCCSWTYCPAGNDQDPERCCLKSKVPAEGDAGHWTGLAPRAVLPNSKNATLSPQCDPNGPTPYPGPTQGIPLVHHSPDCLHRNGWHDVAGALTFKNHHHVFQGCPESGGWSHAHSVDLVHWDDRGIHVSALKETYEGMDSDTSPCSGFVAVDDTGAPCAGFRQCGSNHGVTGLNPQAQPWDVPLEVRCATDGNLTQWTDPQYIANVYFYRALPYDPVRPWKDTDGKWYFGLSTDGCNSTTRATPCGPGGQLDLFTADTFDGPWTQLEPPLFTTNTTYRGWGTPQIGSIDAEFVTSGYFGNMTGDPASDGSTRVVTQNRAGATYWVGKQGGPGTPFTPFWEKPGSVGFYDYGSLTMARTLGSDPNQVAVAGRRVLIGWIGGTPASQSLARDLTLSPEYELLQQFVPELQSLRRPSTGRSLQAEVVAKFSINATAGPLSLFGVDIMCNPDETECASLFFNCSALSTSGSCDVGVDGAALGSSVTSAPLYVGSTVPGTPAELGVHAIVDGQIIEVIFNNRTAMVVYVIPPTAANTGIRPFSAGSNVDIVSMELFDLASI